MYMYGSIIGVTKRNTRSLGYSICGKNVSGGVGSCNQGKGLCGLGYGDTTRLLVWGLGFRVVSGGII